MPGIFQLRNAADLREKLRRDLAKLKAEPLDADAAFNFFVTAEHMLDWAHPGRAGKDGRTKAKQDSTLLRVCSHLANGAKHFEVEARQHDSISATNTVESIITILDIHSLTPPFSLSPKLVVKLKGQAATELGSTIGAVVLAERVMEHWDNQQLELKSHLNQAHSPPGQNF